MNALHFLIDISANDVHYANVIRTSTKAPAVAGPSRRQLFGPIVRALWSLLRRDRFQRALPVARGVRYTETRRRGVAPLADVYLPPGAPGAHPSVVIVHGGGFLIGSRGMKPVRYLASRLVEAGHAVCSIDYRLIFRGGRLAEATDDVTDAIEWWRTQLPGYGLDPARVSLLGISAGGALAMLAASRLEGEGLHRLVSVFGVYDFSYLGGPLARLLPRWLVGSRDREVWQSRSPMFAASAPLPVLLLHGTDDGLVPVGQAHELARRRAAHPTETLILEGEPHAFLNWPGPARETATDAIVRFVGAADGEAS